jgi:hypothetical protein
MKVQWQVSTTKSLRPAQPQLGIIINREFAINSHFIELDTPAEVPADRKAELLERSTPAKDGAMSTTFLGQYAYPADGREIGSSFARRHRRVHTILKAAR